MIHLWTVFEHECVSIFDARRMKKKPNGKSFSGASILSPTKIEYLGV